MSFVQRYFYIEAWLIDAQKALKERGIDQMLEEARADNKENDTEYLKPSIRPSCAYSSTVFDGSAECFTECYTYEL